jgi:hypothetical protein
MAIDSVLLGFVQRAVAARARAEDDLNESVRGARLGGVSVAEIARATDLSEGRVRDIVGEWAGGRKLSDEEVEQVLTWTPGVLIVAAGWVAYPEYRRYSAYVCQRGRGFNGSPTRMGFYANKAIMPEIPTILHVEDDVVFTSAAADDVRARGGKHDLELAELIERMLADGARNDGFVGKVFLLSAHTDTELTFTLDEPVRHTTTGPGTGFTQKHRYVSEGALREQPKTTDELLRIDQANH